MPQSATKLKIAYHEVSDQLNVMRLAHRHQQFDAKSAAALEGDIKVASRDLQIIGELIKRANLNAESAEARGRGLDETLTLATEAPDTLFHVPSREQRFASNKVRLDKITDKIADAQIRVEDFEYKHGKNAKTGAFRTALAGVMRKLADSTEQLDLADEVADQSLAEVEKEVSHLNEEEQSGGPYSYDSVGDDLEHHISE